MLTGRKAITPEEKNILGLFEEKENYNYDDGVYKDEF